MSISVVLADDHHVVRQGLALLLRAEPDIQVVGEAGDGVQAVELVETLRPSVLVVDVMMPGLSGIEVAREVSRRCPATGVVILSMHPNEAFVLEARRAGALGYVLKCAEPGELVKAVRAVHAGQPCLSPPLSERALAAYARRVGAGAVAPTDPLTPREREVLRLVAEGLTNASIAARLAISERTVEAHRASLMQKLALRSPAELIRYALRHGIASLEG
ncbi:MAG: response regulator transcription factor [Verrucomicrobia bacterium]|nr:response regulator transcription factor [Verrucomicrobiota bacterium]